MKMVRGLRIGDIVRFKYGSGRWSKPMQILGAPYKNIYTLGLPGDPRSVMVSSSAVELYFPLVEIIQLNERLLV